MCGGTVNGHPTSSYNGTMRYTVPPRLPFTRHKALGRVKTANLSCVTELTRLGLVKGVTPGYRLTELSYIVLAFKNPIQNPTFTRF